MSDEDDAPVSGRRGRVAAASRGRARFRTLDDSDSSDEEVVFDDAEDVVMRNTAEIDNSHRLFSPERMQEALVSTK